MSGKVMLTPLARFLGIDSEQRSACVNQYDGLSVGFACGCFIEQLRLEDYFRTAQCDRHRAAREDKR